MNQDVLTEMERVKNYFHNKMFSFAQKWNLSEKHHIQSKKSFHHDLLTKKRMNYSLEISYTNLSHSRQILFRYNDGHNANRLIVNSLSFQIFNLNEKLSKTYDIEDFARFLNREFVATKFFIKQNGDTSFKCAVKYIDECLNLLETETLRNIVCNDDWIQIPLNMSPYK